MVSWLCALPAQATFRRVLRILLGWVQEFERTATYLPLGTVHLQVVSARAGHRQQLHSWAVDQCRSVTSRRMSRPG